MARVQPYTRRDYYSMSTESSSRRYQHQRHHSEPGSSCCASHRHGSSHYAPDVYASPAPQPRLVPSRAMLRTPPTAHRAPYDLAPPSKAKAYEATRPSGLYQPSRGAQRDAKWQAKYSERAHLISRASSDVGRIPPPQPPAALSHAPLHMDRVRAEQHAAIAAARRAHAEAMRKETRMEDERKVRAIQLQVFVHARPTPCGWAGCEAVLNSWALLEKHLWHCHLHPLSRGDRLSHERSPQVACRFDNCGELFASAHKCHQHCLITHMGPFSARCPFNCLFEGDKFPDLMAHIGRRHRHATPEDFVPGLIHHKPAHLPPAEKLPRLPQLVNVRPDGTEGRDVFLGGDVSASHLLPTMRTVKAVTRGCWSGKRPRKEHFEDKKGAAAGIAACIENSRRISVVYQAQQATEDPSGVGELTMPMSAVSLPMTAKQAVEAGAELVDITHSINRATHEAKVEMAHDPKNDTRSSPNGSPPQSRSEARPPLRLKLPSRGAHGLAGSERADTDSITSGESETSEVSRYSEFKLKSNATIMSPSSIEGEQVKRSERLKRKAEPLFSASPLKRGKMFE